MELSMLARYWKNLVLEKVSVSDLKIFGTGKKYWYRLTFWVPSHTAVHLVKDGGIAGITKSMGNIDHGRDDSDEDAQVRRRQPQ